MQFYDLSRGAKFFVRGKRFTKTSMGIGEDEQLNGHAFSGLVQIEPDGEPLLLPPADAPKWKPDYGPWNDFMNSLGTARPETE